MQVAKTPIYVVMCYFHFVALCDYNPPTLQTDCASKSDVIQHVAMDTYIFIEIFTV